MRLSARTTRKGGRLADTVFPHLKRAAHFATDRAIDDVKADTRNTIKSVGLGGLANAVAVTSSKKKRREGPRDDAWGAIFARGGQFSRANQALMSYTEGAYILPTGGRKWLAYPTKAAGRLIRLPTPKIGGRPGYANFKNQPSRGRQKLEFIRFSSRRAALVLRNAVVNNRTGKAKPREKRVSRHTTAKDFVVIFWLIPFTRRAARFSQAEKVRKGANSIPRYVGEFQTKFPLKA